MPITLDDLDLVSAKQAEHQAQMAAFDCGDADLNDFARNDCYRYQAQHLSHTRLARLKTTGQIIGFITLSADNIVLETKEKKHLFDFHKQVFYFPALKIARIGVILPLAKQGAGESMLRYAIGLAYSMNNDLGIGCRFITVDAYPKSVSWYEKNGFVFNLSCKPERKNRSMRLDILRGPE